MMFLPSHSSPFSFSIYLSISLWVCTSLIKLTTDVYFCCTQSRRFDFGVKRIESKPKRHTEIIEYEKLCLCVYVFSLFLSFSLVFCFCSSKQLTLLFSHFFFYFSFTYSFVFAAGCLFQTHKTSRLFRFSLSMYYVAAANVAAEPFF